MLYLNITFSRTKKLRSQGSRVAELESGSSQRILAESGRKKCKLAEARPLLNISYD